MSPAIAEDCAAGLLRVTCDVLSVALVLDWVDQHSWALLPIDLPVVTGRDAGT